MEFFPFHDLSKKFKAMIHQQTKTLTWDDLIFENRNKAYGAYQLRINYHKRVTNSLMYSLAGILALFVLPVVLSKVFKPEVITTTPKMKEFVTVFNYDKLLIPQVETKTKELAATGTSKQTPAVDPHAFKPITEPVPDPAINPTSGQIVNPSGTADPGGLIAGNVSNTQPSGTTVDPVVEPSVFNIASVDVQPDFPGGLEKFYLFITKNLRFTAHARDAGLNGNYYVTFIVDESGLINDIKLMRPIGYGQDEMVTQVLSKSPAWKPGLFHSKPCKTQMVLPLNFNLLQ